VSAADIAHVSAFGKTLVPRLAERRVGAACRERWSDRAGGLHPLFAAAAGVDRDPDLRKVGPVHRCKRKKRKTWLAVFRYYLLFSLFVAAPILLAFDAALIRPFSSKADEGKKKPLFIAEQFNIAMSRPVYIINTSIFMPNEPVSCDDMESYLGYINGKPSKSKKIVLRNNGIKTRYYALTKEGKPTHTNAQMAALAVRAPL
jgi:hypothetical protein